MARVNPTIQDLVFSDDCAAPIAVARLFRGGDFAIHVKKNPASEEAGYSNFRLPPTIPT
jgi:hypothetical protein